MQPYISFKNSILLEKTHFTFIHLHTLIQQKLFGKISICLGFPDGPCYVILMMKLLAKTTFR